MARIANRLGAILLGIWLILTGLLPLLAVSIPPIFMSLLAIVAGVLVLLGR